MSEFKRREPKTIHTVGEKLVLQMCKGEKNKMPISRTDQGMICLLDRGAKGFYPYDSEWECEVVEVRDKSLIIKPIKQTRTAEQMKEDFSAKIELIKQSGKTEKIATKVKKVYPYMTNVEVRASQKKEVAETV